MFSHYFFVSNSNFTKERRIYEHIWTYFVYNYIYLCVYIYLYILLYEKFFTGILSPCEILKRFLVSWTQGLYNTYFDCNYENKCVNKKRRQNKVFMK